MSGADPHDTSTGADQSPPGVPRWLKVLLVVGAVLLVLVVLAMVVVGGDHGPGRHTMSGSAIADAPVHAPG